MKRVANFDPGWLAFVFATVTLIIVLLDRAVVSDNTTTHDGLRKTEQAHADATTKLAAAVEHLARAKDAENESRRTQPGAQSPQNTP